ncbi:MAG TPA: hypothetical protein VN578_02200 [Candidatus Binatia bacterium]|jgi:hypothetical protein|nr:hypothetical protein [Candidatus Binatia bacterium]
MRRKVLFLICVVLGLVMLVCGLLVPAYLRAVDISLLQRAGRKTPSLVTRGRALVEENRLGAAELLLEAAREEALPDRENLRSAVTNLALAHPGWQAWGGGESHLELLFGSPTPGLPRSAPTGAATVSSQDDFSNFEPLTEWMVRLKNRGEVLELLGTSRRPVVQELLRCRDLTNTVIFPPSWTASGQAFDAALSICGLLLEEQKMSRGLSDAIFKLASQSRLNSQPLEQLLMDLMSLGQRFNWGQVAEFVGQVQDSETLRLLANFVRTAEAPSSAGAGEKPAVLFAAVELSGEPAAVARYLSDYSQTGLKDLGTSLRFGAGGVNELLRRNQRLYSSALRQQVASVFPFSGIVHSALEYGWRTPWFALTLKWLLYLAGGFLLAAALHYGRAPVPVLEEPLQVRGFHFAREILFALGFLTVVLLLSEPFLSQEGQKMDLPFRLRLPMAGSAAPAGALNVKLSLMNEPILLTLLLFFVLQGLLYTASLVKLAEIRRQRVPARVKLRLLENEDHLFDAGLYLGFVGTIISLILFSIGVIKPSLMAAYSSTSFGIIFVSIFKILNLRPSRRKILLEAESSPEPAMRQAAPTLATTS